MSRRNTSNSRSPGQNDPKGSQSAHGNQGRQDSVKPTQERFIDEMVEETFPASDATQLPGRADSHSEHSRANSTTPPTRKIPQREPPRTIGNQGIIPASRERENSVDLDDATRVTLRLDADGKLLEIALDGKGNVFDARAVDRLIAALSEKRSQMTE